MNNARNPAGPLFAKQRGVPRFRRSISNRAAAGDSGGVKVGGKVPVGFSVNGNPINRKLRGERVELLASEAPQTNSDASFAFAKDLFGAPRPCQMLIELQTRGVERFNADGESALTSGLKGIFDEAVWGSDHAAG